MPERCSAWQISIAQQASRLGRGENLGGQKEMKNERLFYPISTGELERRWTAVRKAMAERKIDALVMQQNNDWLGGYVRWFTDTNPSNGYPRTVIFPAADLMTVIDMGPFGAHRSLDGADETNRGVGDMIFTP